MINGMDGSKTTELQRDCRNLPVTPRLGACIRVLPARRHLAFTTSGILDSHTPDSQSGKHMV